MEKKVGEGRDDRMFSDSCCPKIALFPIYILIYGFSTQLVRVSDLPLSWMCPIFLYFLPPGLHKGTRNLCLVQFTDMAHLLWFFIHSPLVSVYMMFCCMRCLGFSDHVRFVSASLSGFPSYFTPIFSSIRLKSMDTEATAPLLQVIFAGVEGDTVTAFEFTFYISDYGTSFTFLILCSL